MEWPQSTRTESVPEGARDRKAEHIALALDDRMQFEANYFARYAFEHDALPEIDRDEIDTTTVFLGRKLRAPLLISCMTGGTETASEINRNLAAAAEVTKIAVGVGSQRKALEEPSQTPSFLIRELCPSIPLIGNLGAVQLNYGFGIDDCRRAVEMIGADALALHLNPLQEAIQPEGQCNFKGLLPKIAQVTEQLEVPIIAKEVGCGLSEEVARRLVSAGVRILDTAGLGGTSWSRIEASRANDLPLGELFVDWGVPTPESIMALRAIPQVEIIGSGGLRNGLDAAKAIAMGAGLVGMAQRFLEAATHSAEAVVKVIERTIEELEIAMFCVGARNLEELSRARITRV